MKICLTYVVKQGRKYVHNHHGRHGDDERTQHGHETVLVILRKILNYLHNRKLFPIASEGVSKILNR